MVLSETIELAGYRDFVAVARSNVSEVYRAHQDGVDRPVAVKVLLLDDAEAVARFQRELDITVQLGRQHPHIVTVIDTGVCRTGQPCIVMEYYDNGSLHDRLRTRGPLPWGDVLAAGIAVADALAFAHRHDVLHRDVKPQNVLVLPTSYVVADFGIARRVDAAHTSSVDWFSFRHAAPQVLDGDPPSVADDIWSFGSTLLTLLDGRSPFAADNADEDTALAYMKRVRTGQRRPLERRDVPAGLIAVIDGCMRYEPADRYPNMVAVHSALRELAAETRAWAPYARFVEAGGDTSAPTTGRAPTDRAPVVVPPVESRTVRPTAPPGSLSPSALVHLPPPSASDDQASGHTTGLRYPAELSAVSLDEPSPRPRRWALLVAVVLLVGSVVGVAGTWAARTFREGAAPDQGTGPGPTPSIELPTSSAPNINSTRLAPTITQLEATGSSVLIRWTDPSLGEAETVVVRVINNRGEPIGTVAPGTTQFLVEGLDAATAPFCFLLIAASDEERGVSTTRCVEVPA